VSAGPICKLRSRLRKVDTPQPDKPRPSSELEILGEDCPVRRILRLIGDKWTPIVLYCLSGGTRRFSELQHKIPDISKKMLTQVLRELEASGLVERKLYPQTPPKTEYRLTESGRRLHEPTAMLCQWASNNTVFLEEIEAIRNA
jgi:DNA-binding HxlR family transcriptional regulator